MAIKFQYNKTSLQQLEKQLKMRERSLPTIKSKESALRIEVKRTKDEVTKLELQLEQEIQSYENMMALWNEFNPEASMNPSMAPDPPRPLRVVMVVLTPSAVSVTFPTTLPALPMRVVKSKKLQK